MEEHEPVPMGDPKHSKVSSVMLVAAPMLAVVVGLITYASGGLGDTAALALGIAIWTALWWVFEPVPIPVASLVPLALLPLTGVLSAEDVAKGFGHKLILLLLGGFLLSSAMEKSGAHRRLALKMVNLCGGNGGRRLVLGFMLATAFISMWISNTATTLMMLPLAIAVLQKSEDKHLTVPLLLGIAFAANVGGIGTPIGTPPNIVFMSHYPDYSQDGKELTFVDWMFKGIPVTAVMVVVIWLWLTRKIKKSVPLPMPKQGSWTPAETRTLMVFAAVALLWITRSTPFGGWSYWLNFPGANDASIAFLGVIVLFCIPDGKGEGGKLLDWKTANKIPWGLLLLMGSGMALANGFKSSGLSSTIAGTLTGLQDLPPVLLIFCIALVVTFLTELTSNTATTQVLMPILGAAAVGSSIDPALLMIPATISASCAFMLPAATLPNAVVFGTGRVTIRQMMREGFALNLLGACVVTTICYLML